MARAGEPRALRRDRRQPGAGDRREPGVHLLDRRRHRQLCQRAAHARGGRAAAGRCRARGGVHQLLRLRLRAAARRAHAVQRDHRTGARTVESAAHPDAGRTQGLRGGGRADPGRQPGVPDRHLGLDGRARQAAAAGRCLQGTGAAAARARPGLDRGLRRQRGPGAAADGGRPPRRDPRRTRSPVRRRLDQRRRRHPAGLCGRARGLRGRRRQPRDPRHRWRLQRRHHQPGRAGDPGRRAARERHRADHAGLRAGQLQRRAGREAGRCRQRQPRLHRYPAGGAQGAGRRDVLDPAHHRPRREGAGRVQPRAGGRIPPDRLREPPAAARGLQQRPDRRRRDRRRPRRDRAVRTGPGRAGRGGERPAALRTGAQAARGRRQGTGLREAALQARRRRRQRAHRAADPPRRGGAAARAQALAGRGRGRLRRCAARRRAPGALWSRRPPRPGAGGRRRCVRLSRGTGGPDRARAGAAA